MNHTQTNQKDFKPSVVGVDLGSRFTKIAAVEKGTVDIITNEANLRQTPSIVGYGPKERLLGEAGQGKIKSNLANTVIAPQRYLGFDDHSEYILQEGKYVSCPPKLSDGKLLFNVNYQGKKEQFSPEQITAAFVNKINSIVKLNKLTNNYQVIAIPNYFTNAQRKALLNSLRIAKESINGFYGYQLITESTAIGSDYGFYKMNEFSEKEEQAKTVLFVDFGHSKLSVYAMKFTKNYQKVIYEKHLRQLGCKNIDQLMFKFYAELFEKANPNMELSVMQSKKAVLKLFENIEKQRKVLSGNQQYDFNIDCLLQENDFSYTMTRGQFEQLSKPVFDQMSKFFEQVKEKMNELAIKVDHIELIGGGSRIPCFIQLVSSAFGIEPSRTLNSSQCIARGAALCSAMHSGIFRVKQYYSFDVSSTGLYCAWKGENEEMQDEGNKAMILNQNQTVLSEKKVQMTIKPTKPKLMFNILQFNITEGINPEICSFAITFPEATESEKKIALTIKFDSNKLVSHVNATLIGQKEEQLKIEDLVFSGKYSEKQIQDFIAKEREYVVKDAKIVESYEKRNFFESQLYTLKDKLANLASNETSSIYCTSATFNQYGNYFSELEEKLDEIENYEATLKEAQTKVQELINSTEKLKKEHNEVNEELNKLSEFINAVVEGKIKSVKYYPGDEVQMVTKWVNEQKQKLKDAPKYESPCLPVEEVSKMFEYLKQKIKECQAQQLRKEQEEARRQSMRRQSAYQDDFDPFRSPYRPYETQRPRGRGRQNPNMYNSSFFSPFNSFF